MKRSILGLASMFCVLLFAAAQQSAGAHSIQPALLQATAAPTAAATVDPGAFDMATATLYTSPDKVISLKLPTGWQRYAKDPVGTYTFFLAPPNFNDDLSQIVASLRIFVGDPAVLYKEQYEITTVVTSPKEFLQALTKTSGIPASTEISEISDAQIGPYKGNAMLFTFKADTPASIYNVRVANIAPQQVAIFGVQTNLDQWAAVQPVIDKILDSVTVKPELLPTLTPTPPLTVNAGTYQGIHQETLSDGSPILGDPKAKVILLEFADFSCPHCLEYRDTINTVIDQLVRTGKARLMVRTQTFVGGPLSEQAAQAAYCAGKQDAFWEAYEGLFDIQSSRGYQAFTLDSFKELATGLKIDPDKLAACVTNGDTKATLAANDQAAQDLQIQGVPAVLYSTDGGKTFNFLPSTTDGSPVNRGGPGIETITAAVAKANQ